MKENSSVLRLEGIFMSFGGLMVLSDISLRLGSGCRLIPQFRAHERFSFRRGSQHIFKVVIFYLAETRTKEVQISDEHHGYGWFTFRDAKKILGKYRDSQKVLIQAYNFLQGGRRPAHGHQAQGGAAPRGAKEPARKPAAAE